MTRKHHERWMRLAIDLARKGSCDVSPNPMVGCCIVRNNRLVASGYHKVFGGDHAEVVALKKAGKLARGSALYVSLEPCASWGQTPPCVSQVIEAGVKQVIIGSLDPNPKNHGKGVRALRKAGVLVTTGILRPVEEKLNSAFRVWIQKKRPYVTLKMAQSLDGKIATAKGSSRWVTSAKSRQFVQDLRLNHDAILVGTQTWKTDNPSLELRRIKKKDKTKPYRILLDPRLEITDKAKVFRGDTLTYIVVSEKALKKRIALRRASRKGVILLPVPEKNGQLDLKVLLKKLAQLGIARLLVEGGGEIAWSFLEKKWVDRFYWFIAPKFVGGRLAKSSLAGAGVLQMTDAFDCHVENVRSIGKDWLFEGTVI